MPTKLFRVIPPPGFPAPRAGQWMLVDGEFRPRLTQSFAAAPMWVVNHNLGFTPQNVSVRTTGGNVVDAQVNHVSQNQVRIYFDAPTDGVVELS